MSKKKEFKVIVMSVIAFLLGVGGLIVSYTVLEPDKYVIIYLSILNMIWLPLTLAVELFIRLRNYKKNGRIQVKIEEYACGFVPITCTATMIFLVVLAIIFIIF